MEAGRWWLNPSLRLQWTQEKLTAQTDDSRPANVIAPAFVGLLDTFKEPLEVDEAVRLFLSRYADDEEDPDVITQVRDLVTRLQQGAVLVQEEPEGRSWDEHIPGYFARPDTHVMMLSDYVRTAAYREVIGRHVRDKTVVEIGCGSGVLACFAARAGARRVYAIEETAIIDVAREIVRRNGFGDRIEFIHANSLLASIPDQADVVYSEIIGSDPLAERILPSVRDAAQRFLAPEGLMIPRRLSIFAVCLQSAAVDMTRTAAGQRFRQAEELSKTYGLDLSPLVDLYGAQIEADDAASKTYERLELIVDEGGDPGEDILSDEQMIASWDLYESKLGSCTSSGDVEVGTNTSLDNVLRVRLRFPILRPGVHNAMAVYFTLELDDDLSLSNSPFTVQAPISWRGQSIRTLPNSGVAAGDVVEIDALIDPALRPTMSFARSA
jgi:2-polyprenyl-3-methyl-5-hydroxy-6-metoxy-1,4-benzoquinol methylase